MYFLNIFTQSRSHRFVNPLKKMFAVSMNEVFLVLACSSESETINYKSEKALSIEIYTRTTSFLINVTQQPMTKLLMMVCVCRGELFEIICHAFCIIKGKFTEKCCK